MKWTAIWATALAILVGGAFWLTRVAEEPEAATALTAAAPTSNVRVVEGKQVIQVLAKGEYEPRRSIARADVPTVLELRTENTFDCTLEVSIPSLRYRDILPATGTKVVELPPQKAGNTLNGTCWMGMYSFQIRFV